MALYLTDAPQWLTEPTVIETAEEEQADRFELDPWATELSSSDWTPVVVTVPSRGHNPRTASQQLTIPKNRDALARELQKELKRVGCYDGEVNGAWSPSIRRAMKMFIERVNASLPMEEPDPILYAMVRGEHEQVCGKACHVGEGLSRDGRCVPVAILDKAKGRTPTWAAVAAVALEGSVPNEEKSRTVIGWSVTNTSVDTPPSRTSDSSRSPSLAIPIEGRMALAGPSAHPTPETATLTPRLRPVHPARQGL